MNRFVFWSLAVVAVTLSLVACGAGAEPSASRSPSQSPSSSGTTASPTVVATSTPARDGVPTPTEVVVEYTVVSGDTLFSIAQRYGATVDEIVALNALTDANDIKVGQVLRVAGSVQPTTPVATVAPTASPLSGAAAEVIRAGNSNRRMVAFTFDAGSDLGYAELILDTLAANGIEASFGMTGRWAEQNPAMLRRIVDEGHELINHTYDHSSFTGFSTNQPPQSQDERRHQLDRTEQIVSEIAGGTTKPYFRPPYGDYDDSVNSDVGASGYRYNVMWTVDSRGWQGLRDAEITQRCLELAEPGAIYVFHVGGQSLDGVALQDIVDGLEAGGYSIGSVSDVIAP